MTRIIKTVQVYASMRCEMCGRRILGTPYRVIIEGARLMVCTDCAKHGKLTWEEEPKPKPAIKPKGPRPTLIIHAKRSAIAPPDAAVELIEDFHDKVRDAREKLGLSHEELGKRINEKVSLLRKIETGKMTPNNTLATKLEHVLKIKLMIQASEEKVKVPTSIITKMPKRELTLGDLIQLNKSNREDKAERKQS
jgi:putative transcription factor